MAPDGKSELARAGTCTTERDQNRIPDGSSGSQEQEAVPQGRDEVATMTGAGWSCKAVTCDLLVGKLGASGREQVGLCVTTFSHLVGMTGTSGTKSSRLGVEHPGAAVSAEVKT